MYFRRTDCLVDNLTNVIIHHLSKDRVYVRENEFQKYLDKCYVFGMKEKEF